MVKPIFLFKFDIDKTGFIVLFTFKEAQTPETVVAVKKYLEDISVEDIEREISSSEYEVLDILERVFGIEFEALEYERIEK